MKWKNLLLLRDLELTWKGCQLSDISCCYYWICDSKAIVLLTGQLKCVACSFILVDDYIKNFDMNFLSWKKGKEKEIRYGCMWKKWCYVFLCPFIYAKTWLSAIVFCAMTYFIFVNRVFTILFHKPYFCGICIRSYLVKMTAMCFSCCLILNNHHS